MLPSRVGICGSTFKENCCGTIEQRTIHNIRMTCDPSDISDAAENITGRIVEHCLKFRKRLTMNRLKILES